MDKKLMLDGKEYNLVNTYSSKANADRDAKEFNHTSRWEAVVQQDNNKYELYVRKVTADAKAH